ncbi:MAG: CDP-alcohol phosphatidyltransferase family protein [Candidatus Eisenbacteria bacterium]|uniref:CDP-alcohol phosphatidyltransferase family protein n=1 Tax=Eiseniibacteriota bacterium TaxID=2212470 RepID=A0A538U3V7_UNCEI|nr:MAG: CDP-alcohol phosphatidyltransferase family protein [Candidatus Eisenbacteria bacterium]
MSAGSRDPGAPLVNEGAAPFKDRLKHIAHAALEPLTKLLAGMGVSPDGITIMGLLVSLVASLAFFEGYFRFGALMVAIAGVCDILDGELARRSGHRSRFGAFLDSTLDRLSDGMILAGIAGFYLVHLMESAMDPTQALADISRGLEPRTWAVVSLTAVLAMLGSFMVSYTRARAEGLGLECRVGWFERPERMVLLIVAGAFGVGRVMSAALILLALLSFATAIQRVVYIWKNTRGAGLDS